MQMLKIFTTALLCISLTLSAVSSSFGVNIATIGLDPALIATYLAEDESQNTEIINVVNYFMSTQLRPDMTDFEKEIAIIRYLVNTVSYDVDELSNDTNFINDSYKAYGALVNHKAVCSGYAKAFDLLAKKCGLSSIVVTGTAVNSNNQSGPHAWNQIYLDGEWYNVDVTFEDPITNQVLHEGELFNNYINCTDNQFLDNHIRDNGHTCTATKYGKNVVAYYLQTGTVNLEPNVDAIRKIYEQQMEALNNINNDTELLKMVDKFLLLGAKYDSNINFIPSNSDKTINEYILGNLAAGINVISIVTGPNTKDMFSIDRGDWLENNIKVPGKSSLRKIYSTDGKFDTRILIFKFG